MTALKTKFTNGAETTLSSSLPATDTTINVTSTSGFPAVPFYVVIDPDVDASREVILVDSSTTATTFVLSASSQRGKDGTTAISHSLGAKVAFVPVAAHLTDLHDRVDAVDAAKAPLSSLTAIGARAYQATGQSLANGATVAITLDAETFDTDGFHSTTANTSRHTIPASKGGMYVASGAIGFAANATGYRQVRLHINGTLRTAVSVGADATAGMPTRVPIGDVMVLAAGDYVEMYGNQGSGGALSTEATQTFLSLVRIGT